MRYPLVQGLRQCCSQVLQRPIRQLGIAWLVGGQAEPVVWVSFAGQQGLPGSCVRARGPEAIRPFGLLIG